MTFRVRIEGSPARIDASFLPRWINGTWNRHANIRPGSEDAPFRCLCYNQGRVYYLSQSTWRVGGLTAPARHPAPPAWTGSAAWLSPRNPSPPRRDRGGWPEPGSPTDGPPDHGDHSQRGIFGTNRKTENESETGPEGGESARWVSWGNAPGIVHPVSGVLSGRIGRLGFSIDRGSPERTE